MTNKRVFFVNRIEISARARGASDSVSVSVGAFLANEPRYQRQWVEAVSILLFAVLFLSMLGALPPLSPLAQLDCVVFGVVVWVSLRLLTQTRRYLMSSVSHIGSQYRLWHAYDEVEQSQRDKEGLKRDILARLNVVCRDVRKIRRYHTALVVGIVVYLVITRIVLAQWSVGLGWPVSLLGGVAFGVCTYQYSYAKGRWLRPWLVFGAYCSLDDTPPDGTPVQSVVITISDLGPKPGFAGCTEPQCPRLLPMVFEPMEVINSTPAMTAVWYA